MCGPPRLPMQCLEVVDCECATDRHLQGLAAALGVVLQACGARMHARRSMWLNGIVEICVLVRINFAMFGKWDDENISLSASTSPCLVIILRVYVPVWLSPAVIQQASEEVGNSTGADEDADDTADQAALREAAELVHVVFMFTKDRFSVSFSESIAPVLADMLVCSMCYN